MNPSSYLKLTKSHEIARRYFVTNGFDGTISILGILAGSFFAGMRDPRLVLVAGLSVALALGISGFASTYLSEDAEKKSELRKIERAMLKKLRKTNQGKAARWSAIFTSFISGISPLALSMLILLPFILHDLVGSITTMYYLSFTLVFLVLSGLGYYVGRISKDGVLKYMIRTLLVGGLTAVLLYFVGGFF
ncbi:VIT1/CCC1 transporter family protein [Candidatus Woesearchaeota archaeon]|nr:VIT1/CCC1 transporter family protein [Candidatus Woesearchaeota archaeon]